MHTETNITTLNSVNWLNKEWANVHQLKRDGVPIVGFTWYSFLRQVDWDSALRVHSGHFNQLGLFDLNRNIMPVGKAYKRLIEKWKDVLISESYGLNF
jgi:hypothetical protein